MTIARHTHSPREVGFFVEAALSPSSAATVEWNDNGGEVEIYYTDDPLQTLWGLATWTKFTKPGSSGSTVLPSGTRKAAIECTSHDPDDPSIGVIVQDGVTNMEQARIYGVDQLDRLPLLPALGDLIFHYDFSDPTQVFSDVGGTIPAVDGGGIARINNKGSDPTNLLQATPIDQPIYRTGVVGPAGRNCGEQNGSGTSLSASVAATYTFTATGNAFGAVIRRRTGSAPGIASFLWTANRDIIFLPSTAVKLEMSFTTEVIARTELDTWYLVYISKDALPGTVLDAHFGSPGPEVVEALGAAGTVTGPSSFSLLVGDVGIVQQMADFFMWETDLGASQRSQLRSYANARYGSLPHL